MLSCTETRVLLPALLYGDLPPDQAEAARKHLAGCPGCRQEFAALGRVRRLLDEAPAPPEVRVSLPRLFGEAAARRARTRRRWRRAAALAAAAAVVLLGFSLKLEVRVEGHQVVLRWGTPPATPETPTPPPLPHAPRRERAPAEVTAADLRLVRDLIHALAADVESRDRDTQQALLRLSDRLDGLGQQAQERWASTQQLLSALTALQLESHEQGGR
jgi:anti-sigma factor RsiW